jgi:hypothetical protein
MCAKKNVSRKHESSWRKHEDNYVNLQIGGKLTLQQAVAYFIEWVIVGTVIGLIYRPA